MVAGNLAKSTIEGYLYGVKQLVLYYKRPLETIESEDVYAFLVHLKEDRGLSRNTMRICSSGLKYMFDKILKRQDIVKDIPYPKQEKYLPEILTSLELKKLFNSTSNIKHRAFLKLVYSAGLRREEVCNLLITDIDSKNMQVRVRQGKGKKDRKTMLSYDALKELRDYVKKEKPENYLFNGREKGSRLSNNSTSWIMEKAVERAKITKKVSLHNLRHSFASHLLSMGVNLISIQRMLGHEDIRTTMLYIHISNLRQKAFENPLDLIYPPSKK